MDFAPTVEQAALSSSIRELVRKQDQQHVGQEAFGYDVALEDAAARLGLLDEDFARAGLLDQALAIEALARARATFDHAARITLGALLPDTGRTAVVVVPTAGATRRVRYARTAVHLVVLRPGVATARAGADAPRATVTQYGYPVAEVEIEDVAGPELPYEETLLRWRTALVAELCGVVGAALGATIEHVSTRVQFGRPLGSIQTIQQGLTKVHVDLEGCRHLTWAAGSTGNAELAELAAERAVDTGLGAVSVLHQCTGAIGLTREHGLHAWTLRAQALTYELRALRSLGR